MMVRYKNNHSKSKTTTTLAILIRFISNNNKAPLHITRMCVSPRAHAPALLASEPWGRRGVKYNLLFPPRGHAATHGACAQITPLEVYLQVAAPKPFAALFLACASFLRSLAFAPALPAPCAARGGVRVSCSARRNRSPCARGGTPVPTARMLLPTPSWPPRESHQPSPYV